MYETQCAVCKETSHPKEKAHQSFPAQLKRFASFKSAHINVSQLKRICSDPLYPRSPLLEEQINSAPVPSSPTEKMCHSPARGTISSAHRRSSDSDLSTTPKGKKTFRLTFLLILCANNLRKTKTDDTCHDHIPMLCRRKMCIAKGFYLKS